MRIESARSVVKVIGNFKISILAVFIMLMVLISSLAWAGPATDQLRSTLNQIIKVLNDPALKTDIKKDERKNILIKLVKERFDGEEFSKRVLGVHWKKITEAERAEFVKVFSDLLERTYFEKIDMYMKKTSSFSKDNIHYLKESIKGEYAVVATKIVVSKESVIPVYYRIKNKNDNWLVCDIAIEGVSLVKNYRSQFNEVLANASFEELIKKLKSRQETVVSAKESQKKIR